MNEFTVTNGTVEYEHRKPVADYEHKQPKVVLSYTMAEGSDPEAVALKVMAIAVVTVERALDMKLILAQPPVEPVAPTEAASVPPTPPAAAPKVVPPKAVVKPVAKAPVVPVPIEDDPLADTSSKQVAVEVVDDDPLAGGPTSASKPADGHPEPAGSTKQSEASELSDDDLLGLKPAPTVADMQAEAQKTSKYLSEKFGNIGKLRELIRQCGSPDSLLNIPEGNRNEFVEKCKGLRAG